MKGYYNHPDATAQAIERMPWPVSLHVRRGDYVTSASANHFTIMDEMTRPGSPLLTAIAAQARAYSYA